MPLVAFFGSRFVFMNELTAICIRCSADFPYIPIANIIPKLCEDCLIEDSKRLEAERTAEANTARKQLEWERICPCGFRDSEACRLPCQGVSLQILRWPAERRRGFVLWGKTRLGKSRTLFLYLAKCFAAGRRIAAFDCLRFSEEIERWQARFEISKLTKMLSTVDILAFDDVDKVKMSRSAGDKMFAVFSRRCDAGLPTLFTSNANGSGLESVLPHPKPFVARIREFCDAKYFSQP
jgi:hypothetical protein